jgi:ArsR family transcriptional regulator
VTDEHTAESGCCQPLTGDELSIGDAEAAAGLFKALSDPRRVRIVNVLATSPRPLCVCELTEPLGLAQPTISHHLKKLTAAGLLTREQRGVWAYYAVNRLALRGLAAAVVPDDVPIDNQLEANGLETAV